MSAGTGVTKRDWLIRAAAVPLAVVLIVAANYAGREVANHFKPTATKPTAPTAAVPDLSGLTVEPGQLDLGEVWEAKDFVATLTLANATARPITVERFSTGCECSKVEPTSLTVPAGEKRDIRVHIDLTHRQPHQRGVANWPLTASIMAVLEQADIPTQPWRITGKVRAWASADTGWLDFDDRCHHKGPPYTRTVRFKRHAAFERLVASVEPDKASVAVRSIAGSRGDFEVAITPNPDGAAGPFSFEVGFEAVEANGSKHPVGPLLVRGEMQPLVQILPRVVLLGEHPVGTRANGELSLQLPVGEGWSVKQIESGSPDLRIKSVSSSEPAILRYALNQRIATAGDLRVEVTFVLANPKGESVRVNTEILSYGTKE